MNILPRALLVSQSKPTDTLAVTDKKVYIGYYGCPGTAGCYSVFLGLLYECLRGILAFLLSIHSVRRLSLPSPPSLCKLRILASN